MQKHASSTFPMWGGVECTMNRVGQRYFDQLARSRHRKQYEADLRCFFDLGLRTLRVGLQWERWEQTKTWAEWDRMLAVMAELGMEPIVGLLHHGSGPRSTDLLDPAFPEKFAAYALEVARRYPHVEQWTPINEPQTTGRFACLYGHWFPHQRSMPSYVRALLNQIKGIALAMRAIRAEQPVARLVHTEDAGKTYAPPQLEDYRRERDHRRWLGMDLLCGRVDGRHPLSSFLREHGASERELFWFSENACPPAVVGLNYYVTSDRFLDDRLELYPGRAGGDCGDEPLVDVEAVRVHPEGIAGAGAVLREAWDRYHLPLAITEAHLGCCEPLEQRRWLAEVWREAQAAQRGGVDVRAVTAWALLGSSGWSDLCTRSPGVYERGVFDVSRGSRRATPLTELVQRLAQGLPPDRADLTRGWWRSPDRFTFRYESEGFQDVPAMGAPGASMSHGGAPALAPPR